MQRAPLKTFAAPVSAGFGMGGSDASNVGDRIGGSTAAGLCMELHLLRLNQRGGRILEGAGRWYNKVTSCHIHRVQLAWRLEPGGSAADSIQRKSNPDG